MTLTKLDVSGTCVVVTCKECTWWYAFAWNRSEGHERANDHERRVHPTVKGASAARAMHRRRHAAT